jgi:hypothetical protein
MQIKVFLKQIRFPVRAHLNGTKDLVDLILLTGVQNFCLLSKLVSQRRMTVLSGAILRDPPI